MRLPPLFPALFVILLVSINARADYQPLALTELFGGSDLIILGTIESVGKDRFRFSETEVYAGDIGDAPVQVNKYRDWTGGRRWSAYRAGQTVLLFLSKPGEEDAAGEPWRIRGLGGEGEMPIENGGIFPHGLNLDGFERKTFLVDGGELYGYSFDLETFESALIGYLRCFGSREAAAEGFEEPARGCSDSELESYRAASPLHRYLVSSRSG